MVVREIHKNDRFKNKVYDILRCEGQLGGRNFINATIRLLQRHKDNQ